MYVEATDEIPFQMRLPLGQGASTNEFFHILFFAWRLAFPSTGAPFQDLIPMSNTLLYQVSLPLPEAAIDILLL